MKPILLIIIVVGILSSCSEDDKTWSNDSDPLTKPYIFSRLEKPVNGISASVVRVSFVVEYGYKIKSIIVTDRSGGPITASKFSGSVTSHTATSIEQIKIVSGEPDGQLIITFDGVTETRISHITIKDGAHVYEYDNGIVE